MSDATDDNAHDFLTKLPPDLRLRVVEARAAVKAASGRGERAEVEAADALAVAMCEAGAWYGKHVGPLRVIESAARGSGRDQLWKFMNA